MTLSGTHAHARSATHFVCVRHSVWFKARPNMSPGGSAAWLSGGMCKHARKRDDDRYVLRASMKHTSSSRLGKHMDRVVLRIRAWVRGSVRSWPSPWEEADFPQRGRPIRKKEAVVIELEPVSVRPDGSEPWNFGRSCWSLAASTRQSLSPLYESPESAVDL